jgi:hypothetical protein
MFAPLRDSSSFVGAHHNFQAPSDNPGKEESDRSMDEGERADLIDKEQQIIDL